MIRGWVLLCTHTSMVLSYVQYTRHATLDDKTFGQPLSARLPHTSCWHALIQRKKRHTSQHLFPKQVHTHAYVHACTYACLCMYTYHIHKDRRLKARIHANIHSCVCMHLYRRVCTFTCVRACFMGACGGPWRVRQEMCLKAEMFENMHTYMHTCVCILRRTSTYIHACIHTHVWIFTGANGVFEGERMGWKAEVFESMHTYIYAYIDTYKIHTYINTKNMHTYIRTHNFFFLKARVASLEGERMGWKAEVFEKGMEITNKMLEVRACICFSNDLVMCLK